VESCCEMRLEKWTEDQRDSLLLLTIGGRGTGTNTVGRMHDGADRIKENVPDQCRR
jgi:hypothetical protein